MHIPLGDRGLEIQRMSLQSEEEYFSLKLQKGPHLFTDWRYILAGDVWGGFHWASRETDEVIPVKVKSSNGDFTTGPIEAKMVSDDLPQGIRIIAQKARKSEPFPVGEPPGQIIYNGGCYSPWYNPHPGWVGMSKRFENAFMYSESKDGFSWNEPTVCRFDWSDCPDVSAIELPNVFLDPSAPSEERYKLVFLGNSNRPEHKLHRKKVLEEFFRTHPDDFDPTALSIPPGQDTIIINYARYGAVSADGILWKVLPLPLMIILSDAQNVVYYDKQRKKYVWYLKSEWYAGRRCIARAETKNFLHWPLAETILFPGPDLLPSDDWYTNSKTMYPESVNHHLMFPALYHHATDASELRMFSSPDGVSWTQVPGGAVLSPGEPGSWDGGFLTASTDLVPLPNNQVGIPYSASFYPHKYPRNKYTMKRQGKAYALWHRERLAALEAGEVGSFSTLPLTLTGRKLRLNIQTSMAGEVLVEATKSKRHGGGGEPIPGRSFSDCLPIVGNEFDHIVTWKNGQDIGYQDGTPITFKFHLRAAKLFAFEII